MNSILQENYAGGLFGAILFIVIFHYVEKWFLKEKLKSKEEFEKFVLENDVSKGKDYNYKKYDMDIAKIRYRGIVFSKWLCIVLALIALYKLIS